LTLDVKKSNSSNETPNVMTVGVENYGLSDSRAGSLLLFMTKLRASKVAVCCFSWGICYDFYGVKTAAGG
jgi:hypothetical protein